MTDLSVTMQDIVNQTITKKYNDNLINQNLIRTSNLILNESYFIFNDQIYQQLKGVPMGSPIAGIIAEWKLHIIEVIISEKLGEKIHTWLRYVDDVFAIINA